jgi:hypothetical protein
MVDHARSHSVATIEAALSAFEDLLKLRPVGHEHRAEAVGDLGNTLFFFCFLHKADHTQRVRCLGLLREALQLCPLGNSSHDRALHNLARALLFLEYQQQPGDLDYISESVLLNRAALKLRPAGHPEREKTLGNLACGLARSFQDCGDLDLLAEAITTHRELVRLCPSGSPDCDVPLTNLSIALQASFRHQGGSETLAEAISTSREALQLQPAGSSRR